MISYREGGRKKGRDLPCRPRNKADLASRRGISNKILYTAKKFGLSRFGRLSSKQVIDELFLMGSRFHLGNVTIIYLPSDKRMAGFVASKRIGGVVKRNRAKRILREAYRMNKDVFRGLKVIFYVHGSLKFNEVVDIFYSFKEGR